MSVFRSINGVSNFPYEEYFTGQSLSDSDLDKIVKINLGVDDTFVLPSITGNNLRQVFFKLVGSSIVEFITDDPGVTVDGFTAFTLPSPNGAVRLVVDEFNNQYHILSSYTGALTEESSSSSNSSSSTSLSSSSSPTSSSSSSTSLSSTSVSSSSTINLSTSSTSESTSSSTSVSTSSSTSVSTSSTINLSTSSETSSSSSSSSTSLSTSSSSSTINLSTSSTSLSSSSSSSTINQSTSSTSISTSSSTSVSSSSSSLTEGEFDQSQLLLWYRADADAYNVADTTLATNGQDVVQLKNQVSNNYHLETTGRNPVFTTNLLNGKPGLVFDGSLDFMWYPNIISELEAARGRSIIYVYNADDSGGSFPDEGTIISYKNNENPLKRGWDVKIDDNGGSEEEHYGVDSGINSNFFTFYNQNNKGAILHDDIQGSIAHYIRGEERSEDPSGNLGPNYETSRLVLGAVFDNGGGLDPVEKPFRGTLYEVLVFTGRIGNAQLESVESYLDNKYNLLSQTYTSSVEFSSFSSSSSSSTEVSVTSSSTSSSIEFSSFSSSSSTSLSTSSSSIEFSSFSSSSLSSTSSSSVI